MYPFWKYPKTFLQGQDWIPFLYFTLKWKKSNKRDTAGEHSLLVTRSESKLQVSWILQLVSVKRESCEVRLNVGKCEEGGKSVYFSLQQSKLQSILISVPPAPELLPALNDFTKRTATILWSRYVCLWEEARIPGGNSRRQGENMRTPHCAALASGSDSEVEFSYEGPLSWHKLDYGCRTNKI